MPRAVDILTDDHVATIYEAYQADIYLSLEDFRREVARWDRELDLQNQVWYKVLLGNHYV
jgi:hypothetical protein